MTDRIDDGEPEQRGPLGLAGSVWFKSGEQTLGGASRIALLAAIHETGSITGAAKAVGMSYKAAWDAIDTMNNLAGEPLVVRSTGGKGGGGTTLTARALTLIDTFRTVESEHRKFLERAGAAIEGFAGDWALIGRIGMKTSARNQLFGKIASIHRGTVNDEVSLALPGGQTIVSVLTHESTETLGLKEGDEVNLKAELDNAVDLQVIRAMKRADAIRELRKFRGMMPEGFKFNRDEANER